MAYQKFCYWVDLKDLQKVKKDYEQKGIKLYEETRIPCRVLRISRELSYLDTSAWYSFCKRRTSWYWKSEKVGKTLIASNWHLNHLDIGSPIIIAESDFRPERPLTVQESFELIQSKKYQDQKPTIWEKVESKEIEFYKTWFKRYRPNETFDFNKIFTSHCANHANFLDPKFFVTVNGVIAPYSISDSLHVCSSCMEFFNILGAEWLIKYVVPCIGAVLFAHLPMDRYLEVKNFDLQNL